MAFTPLDRNGIAAWCAHDILEGWLVNLGIGIPTLVADFVPPDREVIFHAENGVIGVGPAPVLADSVSRQLVSTSLKSDNLSNIASPKSLRIFDAYLSSEQSAPATLAG